MEQADALIFTPEDVHVYAVLDGAAVPGLLDKLYTDDGPEFECLLRGDLDLGLAEVAPYLVRLKPGEVFTRWLLRDNWGKHRGIFAQSRAALLALRLHFRRFLRVYDPAGKPMYFRFYDPRVLRVYLPTCNAEEVAAFFGPVAAYILEDEQPGSVLRLENQGGRLVRRAEQLEPA